jgi:hypothetical protein
MSAAMQSLSTGQELGARWGDAVRLPLAFDAAALEAALVALEAEEWTAHFVPQHFTGDWSVIPLRAPAGATHPIMKITSPPGETDWVDTALLVASSGFRAVLDALPGPLYAARLMRLGADSQIHEHSDHDLAAEMGMVRLHIPVRTNADVDFRLNGRRIVMAVGEVWYLRLADRHSVRNRGETDRVHLVVDIPLNAALTAVLDAGEAAAD